MRLNILFVTIFIAALSSCALLSPTSKASTKVHDVVHASPSSIATDSSEIDKIVQFHVEQNHFSGTILIAQAGQISYHQSFGPADVRTGDAIQNTSKHGIASITKFFTSIRILQLVESGQLALTQSVAELLPALEVPDAETITVHHLLLHISGLPNERDRIYLQRRTPQEMLSRTFKRSSSADLGSFNYNNIDYILLGLIIEEVTGTAWDQDMQNHILAPLDMKDTGFLSRDQYPEPFSYPYTLSKDKTTKRPDSAFFIENFYAAGNMYSTSSDLLKLDQALYSSDLLGEAMYEILATSYPEHGYAGYGVWNYQYPFADNYPLVMERRGGIRGNNVVLVRLPDTKHTLIILSNNDQFNPDSFGRQLQSQRGLDQRTHKVAKMTHESFAYFIRQVPGVCRGTEIS